MKLKPYTHILNANQIKKEESVYVLINTKLELLEIQKKLKDFISDKEKEYDSKVDGTYLFVKCSFNFYLFADYSCDPYKIIQELIINDKKCNIVSVKTFLREINRLLATDTFKKLDSKNVDSKFISEKKKLTIGKDLTTQKKLNIVMDKFLEGELSAEELQAERQILKNDYIINLEVDKFDELDEIEMSYALKSFDDRSNQYLANFLTYSQILQELSSLI